MKKCVPGFSKAFRTIGKGVEGIAYLMPDGNVLKATKMYRNFNIDAFQATIVCMKEASKRNESPHVLDYWLCDKFAFTQMTDARMGGYMLGNDWWNANQDNVDQLQQVFINIANVITRVADQTGWLFHDAHLGNVFVQPDTLRVRIIDWGLATDIRRLDRADLTYHLHQVGKILERIFKDKANRRGDPERLWDAWEENTNFLLGHHGAITVAETIEVPRRETLAEIRQAQVFLGLMRAEIPPVELVISPKGKGKKRLSVTIENEPEAMPRARAPLRQSVRVSKPIHISRDLMPKPRWPPLRESALAKPIIPKPVRKPNHGVLGVIINPLPKPVRVSKPKVPVRAVRRPRRVGMDASCEAFRVVAERFRHRKPTKAEVQALYAMYHEMNKTDRDRCGRQLRKMGLGIRGVVAQARAK